MLICEDLWCSSVPATAPTQIWWELHMFAGIIVHHNQLNTGVYYFISETKWLNFSNKISTYFHIGHMIHSPISLSLHMYALVLIKMRVIPKVHFLITFDHMTMISRPSWSSLIQHIYWSHSIGQFLWSHVDHVERERSEAMRRNALVLVQVWSGTPLVVKGFSTIFCFFSVWTTISTLAIRMKMMMITLRTCNVVEALGSEAGWQL